MDRAIEITADRITAYAARRREEPSKPGGKGFVKPATIRNELAALKRMFSLAVRAGKLPVRPAFPVIRVENARAGFFEDEQFRRVLDHLPEALRPAAVFAFYTGWRRGEVFGLQWSQVDFKAGVVRLEPGTTKNGEGRTFPFDVLPELASTLRQQRSATEAFQRESRRIVPCVPPRR